MYTLNTRIIRYLGALIVLFCGHSMVKAQPPTELLDELRSRYEAMELLRASFTQKTTSPFGDELPANRGTLLLRGDHYRVETDIQTFVTNGETTWVYDASQNQVLVNDYINDEATFSLSDFLHNFDSEFEVRETSTRYVDGEQFEIIQMASLLDEAFFREVTLTVRKDDYLITRLIVVDVNSASLDFSLDDIEINPIIEGDPFIFIPPGDAEIIDLRS